MAAKRQELPSEMKNALDRLTRDSANQRVYVKPYIKEGTNVTLVPNPHGTGQNQTFDIGIGEVNQFEDWVVSHPLLGVGRRYLFQIFEAGKDGKLRASPTRQFELNLADPSEIAASTFAANVTQANRAAETSEAVMRHEVARGEQAVDAALARVNEIPPNLAETDPQKFIELVEERKKELAAVTDHLNSSKQALAGVLATSEQARNMNNAARSTPLQFTNPLGQVVGGYQQYPGQQPGQYPQYPNPYGQQPGVPMSNYPPPNNGWYPPPYGAAPPPEKISDSIKPLMDLVTVLVTKGAAAPVAPAGPSPELLEMRRQFETQQREMSDLKTALVQSKAEADRARQDAEHKAAIAELRAEVARMKDKSDKPPETNTALEIAKLQADSNKAMADMQSRLLEKISDVQQKANEKMIEILQDGSGDDMAEQMKKVMSVQSEVFGQGMQVVRLMSQVRQGNEKEDNATKAMEGFFDKLMDFGAGVFSGGATKPPEPQGPPQQQYAQPPQFQGGYPPQYQPPQLPPPQQQYGQQPQYQQPGPQDGYGNLPQPHGQQIPPPSAPIPNGPHLQVVPPPGQAGPQPTIPDAPILAPEEWVRRARGTMMQGHFAMAFRELFTGFKQHPEMLAGRHTLQAAQAIFAGHIPQGTQEPQITGALVEVWGPDVVQVLQGLNEAPVQGQGVGPGPNPANPAGQSGQASMTPLQNGHAAAAFSPGSVAATTQDSDDDSEIDDGEDDGEGAEDDEEVDDSGDEKATAGPPTPPAATLKPQARRR